MFVNTDEVQDITSFEVNDAHVQMAHYIMEAYIGRGEEKVVDNNDLRILRLATAYQAVYMLENTNAVFEQVGASEIQQDKFRVKLTDSTSPYIAPLAKLACERLSWFRSRSISTAPVFHRQRAVEGWRSS